MVGVLTLPFGLLWPAFTRLLLAAPKAVIAVLVRLAMPPVLQTSFSVSFRSKFTLGALVTFLVTMAVVPILNVGAPFWGLVLGIAVSWLLERADLAPTAS